MVIIIQLLVFFEYRFYCLMIGNESELGLIFLRVYNWSELGF